MVPRSCSPNPVSQRYQCQMVANSGLCQKIRPDILSAAHSQLDVRPSSPVYMEALGCPSIVAFEKIDGTRRWHYTLGDDFCGTIWSQPVLADGAVFVDTSLHNVTALGDLSQQD